MAGKILQVNLSTVEIINRGPDVGSEDVTVIEFTLWYPYPGVNAVKTIKSIPVKKDIPDFNKEGWRNRVVFKQEVVGDLVLEVKAVAVNNPSVFGQFLTKIFSGGVRLAVGAITGGVSNVVANLIVSQIGSDAANNIEASKVTQPLGQGEVALNSYNLDSGKVTIKLDMPQSQGLVKIWGNPDVDPDLGGVDILVPPGANNGKVVLDLQVL